MNSAELIKTSVTMEQTIEVALPEVRIRHHRMPCPFHNGKDDNMRLYRNSYYCFVCHESGDEIKFIEKLYGLGFLDAQKWFADKFGLDLSFERQPKYIMERQIRKAKNERNQARGYSKEQYEADRKEWDSLVNAFRTIRLIHFKCFPTDAEQELPSFQEVRNREELMAELEEKMQAIEERLCRYERGY